MAEAERTAAASGPAHAPPAFDAAGAGRVGGSDRGLGNGDMAALREEIRRLVVEELSQIVGGSRG
jgi:hypothetical protein